MTVRMWSRRTGRWSAPSSGTCGTTPLQELLLLNQNWKLQSLMTNSFYPQQKLVSKVRVGAKITKTYDRPRTPMMRTDADQGVASEHKARLAEQYADLNPAAI